MKFKYLLFSGLLLLGWTSQAKEIAGLGSPRKSGARTLNELCSPATAQIDLSLNNVRTTILAGGDMWWNLNMARYEVPKGSNRHSMFAGSLWLGGLDEGNQLKLAAMTYRQRGNDFWPGPLSNDGLASVTGAVCRAYDRFWLIFRSQVEIHRAWLRCLDDPDCDAGDRFPGYEGEVPNIIRNWPGNGVNAELDFRLAPFFDRDGNDIYDWRVDYPAYDLDRELDCRLKETDLLYGDKTIWFVYNDRGNIHTETQAGALGFEIRGQAFAFATNDELNNATFYNYRILNKSTFRLTNTFFGTWFDADLGDPYDDLIGCDIPRGLGYVYNANSFDAGPLGYGANPPAIGLDFFQGPFADYFDGVDNDRDGCVDGVRDDFGICQPENPALGINERIIMSNFMYYNNTNNALGNPNNAAQFYGYLQSIWRDGLPLREETPCGPGCGGNGDGYDPSGVGPRTNYAFPGNSFDSTTALPRYPTSPTNWFESPENLNDKRGLHGAGPFSLAPGALNFITTGAVWARNFQSDALFASVDLLIIADDKAQALFDNCFQILDGPDAPFAEVVELDREVILNLVYDETSNNFNFGYRQRDPLIPIPVGATPAQIQTMRDTGYFDYKFEGFQIFQLRNAQVSVGSIYDDQQARLVAQCDIRNGFRNLINVERNPETGLNEGRNMTIQAENNGIRMSFRFTEDAFASGLDRRLINHREYHYLVLAYSVNEFIPFNPQFPEGTQATPYLAGRRTSGQENILVYTVIPRITDPEKNGLGLNARYGDQPEITQYEGMGNQGNFLRLRPDVEEKIVRNFRADTLTYLQGFGPLNIKVVDPKRVPAADFEIRLDTVGNTAKWILTSDILSSPIVADTTIGFKNEQIISEIGLSVSLYDIRTPGADPDCDFRNGVIGSNVIHDDPLQVWLGGITDNTSYTPFNWIASGTFIRAPTDATDPGRRYLDRRIVINDDPFPFDGCRHFATMVNGTWAPYSMARDNTLNLPQTLGMGPARQGIPELFRRDVNLTGNVDIVFTSDSRLWTRVPVFEMGEEQALNEGNAPKFTLRRATSLSLSNGNLVEDPSLPQGWSYFPGYAIDVETGRRLNMAFGENSFLIGENGNDMKWNPTSTVQQRLGRLVFGGQHYIYVFSSEGSVFPIPQNPELRNFDLSYKGDNPQDHPLFDRLMNIGSATAIVASNVFGNIDWASIPMLNPGFSFDPYTAMPAGVRVQLRLNTEFKRRFTSSNTNNGFPSYKFSTRNLAASPNNQTIAENALDIIRAVPNPYFAYSLYETSQLDNRIKITNLPIRCNVNIFTPNGVLIRTITKDNSDTWVEWDLKNQNGVPIASGVYLIHVDAPGIGNKVIKWFGTMRPVDLNAF